MLDGGWFCRAGSWVVVPLFFPGTVASLVWVFPVLDGELGVGVFEELASSTFSLVCSEFIRDFCSSFILRSRMFCCFNSSIKLL